MYIYILNSKIMLASYDFNKSLIIIIVVVEHTEKSEQRK